MTLVLNLILFSYFFRVFELFPVGSYGFTFIDLSIIIFFAHRIKSILWNGEDIYIIKKTYLFSLLALALFAVISGLNPIISPSPGDLSQFLKSFSHFAFFLLFALMLMISPIDNQALKKSLKIWLSFSIVINIFGAYQIYARAFDMPFAWLEISNSSFNTRDIFASDKFSQISLKFKDFYRATSIFPEPSALATFNLIVFCFTFVQKYIYQKCIIENKILLNFILLASISSMLLTFSLTAVAGIGIIMFSLLVFEKKKDLKNYIYFFLGGLLILGIADRVIYSYAEISVLELFYNRIESILSIGSRGSQLMAGESFNTRMYSAGLSFNIWQNNMLFGTGMGLTFSNGHILSFSDYSFLQALVEMGLFGALTFSLFLFSITYELYRIRMKLLIADLEKLLITSSLYMMLILLFLNHFTTNNLIGAELWVPLSIPLILILNYNIRENPKVKRIKMTSIAIKTKIEKGILSVLSNNKN